MAADRDSASFRKVNTAKRAKRVAVAVLLLFALVSGKLIWVGGIKGKEYKNLAEQEALVDETITNQRGTIYDSKMGVVAQSAISFTVFVDPYAVCKAYENAEKADSGKDSRSLISRLKGIFKKKEATESKSQSELLEANMSALISKLAVKLGVSEESLRRDFGSYYNSAGQPQRYVKLASDLSDDDRKEIRAFGSQIKEEQGELASSFSVGAFIGFNEDSQRFYPKGSFAAQLIGYLDSEGNGTGLEKYYDEVLTGTVGRETYYSGVLGTIDSSVNTEYGSNDVGNIVLTVDPVIQNYLQEALDEAFEQYDAGYTCGVVMDVKTGAVLGMGVAPGFDLNNRYEMPEGYTDVLNRDAEYTGVVYEDSDTMNVVWNNRAVTAQGFLQPGSVFKSFLVSSCWEEGVVDENTIYYCNGDIDIRVGNENLHYHCFNHSVHGEENIRDLLVLSCNLFSINIGEKLGRNRFFKYYEAFGFTQPTGIDTAYEAKPTWADETKGKNGQYFDPSERFNIANLYAASFGETVYITPLQVVTAMSAIADDGVLHKPYVVDRVIDSDGNIISKTEPRRVRQVISAETSEVVRTYLEDVPKSGTQKNAYVPGYRVAIKTGTAATRVQGDDVMCSVAGFAPADDPEIAIIFDVYEPTQGAFTGGTAAGPYVGQLFEKILKYLNVEPRYTEEELDKLNVSVPAVTGISLESAIEAVNARGLEVTVIGEGDTVYSQVPEYGREIPKEGTVVLYTQPGAQHETVEVPNFDAMSYNEAFYEARYAGLNLIAKGDVSTGAAVAYKQDIAAGKMIERGEVITVSFKRTTSSTD